MKKLLTLSAVAVVAVLFAGTSADAQYTEGDFCASPRETLTFVGTDAGAVPSSNLAGRRFIYMCNSRENSGSPVLKCRIDGTNPAMGVDGGAGEVLAKGDCVKLDVGSGTNVKCIADTANTAVHSTECK